MPRVPMEQLRELADELGRLQAQLADLEQRKKEIHDIFKQSGHKSIDGKLFRVKITSYIRHALDMTKIRAMFTEMFINQSLMSTTKIQRVICSARTTDNSD